MTTTTINKTIYGFVEVHDDAANFFMNWKGSRIVYDSSTQYDEIEIMLPFGKWQYLFCSLNATEEQVAGLVEIHLDGKLRRGYKHYINRTTGFIPRGFNAIHVTALESFQTLLQSLSLDTNKNYAVIQKID